MSILSRMTKAAGALLCAAALALMMPGVALADDAGHDWVVSFDGSKLASDGNLQQRLSGLQPGDSRTFTITLVNDSGETVDWWMRNAIQDTMEQAGAAGAAYTYTLTFIDGSGSMHEIFSNDAVGGDAAGATFAARAANEAQPQSGGLFNATQDTGMEDWFFLDTFAPGAVRTMSLTMGLDPETHTNAYFDTDAGAILAYAVEPVSEDNRVVVNEETLQKSTTDTTPLGKTGDLLGMTTMVALVLGFALAAAAVFFGMADRRKNKEEAQQ